MQSYTEIPSTETLANSRTLLLNNDKTVMSCNSGTSFPTTNLQVGMLCFRTDLNQLFQLKDLTPTWVKIADVTKTLTDKEYVDAQIATRVATSDVVTTATASKILKLDANAKLPASITGDAATVGGKSPGTSANNVLVLDASGKVPQGNLPAIPANNLPIASASALGAVKVGTNLSIDANGVLSISSNLGNQVSILTGTVAHGGTIPLPAGYTENQCNWIISVDNRQVDDDDTIECFTSAVVRDRTNPGRVATNYTSQRGGRTSNYIIIGVK